VRRVLRENNVRPHEAQSPLRDIDWRLPNRDLAHLWGTSARYVANLRARLGAGPAAWNARSASLDKNRAYAAAVAAEKQKAQRARRKRRPSAQPMAMMA